MAEELRGSAKMHRVYRLLKTLEVFSKATVEIVFEQAHSVYVFLCGICLFFTCSEESKLHVRRTDKYFCGSVKEHFGKYTY